MSLKEQGATLPAVEGAHTVSVMRVTKVPRPSAADLKKRGFDCVVDNRPCASAESWDPTSNQKKSPKVVCSQRHKCVRAEDSHGCKQRS